MYRAQLIGPNIQGSIYIAYRALLPNKLSPIYWALSIEPYVSQSRIGLFCVCLGLFWVCIGLFWVCIGLFWVRIGLF